MFFRPSIGFRGSRDDRDLDDGLEMYFSEASVPVVVLTGGGGGDCMANDGCFFGLRPIAEAIELKLRPLDFCKPCREDLSGLAFAGIGNLDHQVREEVSGRVAIGDRREVVTNGGNTGG